MDNFLNSIGEIFKNIHTIVKVDSEDAARKAVEFISENMNLNIEKDGSAADYCASECSNEEIKNNGDPEKYEYSKDDINKMSCAGGPENVSGDKKDDPDSKDTGSAAPDKKYYSDEIKRLLEYREDFKERSVSVVIKDEECDEVPVGVSKMGGLPDLPPGIDYPEREEYTNEEGSYHQAIKLPLICQLNLAELAVFEELSYLPESGMLYIFWDGGDPEYFRKKYKVKTLRAYYWNGSLDELTRREADQYTEVRDEKKVTFYKFDEIRDVPEIEWECMIEDLTNELESECKKLGIDYEDTDEYKKIQDISFIDDESVIYGGNKFSGFKAGLITDDEPWENIFLQLDEHTGSLWYAYIDVHINKRDYADNSGENKKYEWTEISASVDYDAD